MQVKTAIMLGSVLGLIMLVACLADLENSADESL
jgi:hypothetical protein